MPIASTTDHPRRQIRSVAAGAVGYAHIAEHLAQEKQAETLSYRELVDGRDALPTFGPDEARGIVEPLRTLGQEVPIGRKAIVAPRGIAFALTRMIEMLSEDFCEVRAFLDENEARLWLERE
jgi:hypothetical protein